MTTGVMSDWEIHFCEKATRLIVISSQIAPVAHHLAFLEGLQQRPDLRVEAGYQLDLLNIGKAWLLWRLGRTEEARAVFERLNPEGHFPFDRTIGRIFHHALGEHLHPEEPLHREGVEAEVRSSGYVGFPHNCASGIKRIPFLAVPFACNPTFPSRCLQASSPQAYNPPPKPN